jgi:hypothetical protein
MENSYAVQLTNGEVGGEYVEVDRSKTLKINSIFHTSSII